ncbi:MAG: ABC transporter substrate-binding protein [Hyphomicrobiales bacterium]|nr:MAG: ABC transporter substrate-binding protein [Hyphomicrobiales bacterium]
MSERWAGLSRRISCVASIVIVFIALSSLLAASIPAQARDTLRIAYAADIGTFDPDNGFEAAAMAAINNVYEGLVEYAPGTTRIIGRLAQSWDISEDGLTYTFHLAKGVRFHDGTLLDASAVVSSLERRRSPSMVLNYFLGNVKDIRAEDDSTLVVRLQSPQPSFLDALASPWAPKVISPSAMKEHDKNDLASGWLNEHAVGTGPYRLTEFRRGEIYVFERNEDYWRRKPYFKRIEAPVIPDISQQILQLRAGDIDAVPKNYPIVQLSGLPETLEITSSHSMTQYSLFIKAGSPLDDANIRRAVLTAINPVLWMKDVFGNHAILAPSPFQSMMFKPALPIAFPTDMAAARSTIAAKGKVSITIGLYSNSSTYGRIADLMTAQLAAIGIEATSHVLPPGGAFALKGDAKAPDLLLAIASPDSAHPESQATAFLTRNAPANFYGRSAPTADALVAEASRMTDVAARNALYEKAGHLYFAEGNIIPLVEADDVVVHVKGLKDLGLRPVYPPGNIDFYTVHE